MQSDLVLVAGGTRAQRTAELYDPRTRAWSATGLMVEDRRDHVAVALNSTQVLVVGGTGQGPGGLTTAELYTSPAM